MEKPCKTIATINQLKILNTFKVKNGSKGNALVLPSVKFILSVIYGVTNYSITVPMHQSRSEEIGDALIDNVVSKYCMPDYIVMGQDSAFMSSLKIIY